MERDAVNHRLAVLGGRVVASMKQEAVGFGEVRPVAGDLEEEVPDVHARAVVALGLLCRERGEGGVAIPILESKSRRK